MYILPEGLRFTVEEAHTIQGSTMLEKSLFSSYSVKIPDDLPAIPAFQINIAALLETLQIFGLSETNSAYKHQNGGLSSSYAAAFSTPALNLGGTCRISYAEVGAPLSITIDEGSVKTTCEMHTYEIPAMYNEDIEIPLDRNNLTLKVIMKSAWLHDAITELANTSPEVLVVNASNSSAPYFSLEGQGGPFGDSMVDLTPESRDHAAATIRNSKQPQATEIFTVRAPKGRHGRVKQSYRFDLIKKAGKAMQLASKVSIRQDQQGVLSLQFMIEGLESASGSTGPNEGTMGGVGTGRVSFIDFRFVALYDGAESDSQGDDDGSTQSQE